MYLAEIEMSDSSNSIAEVFASPPAHFVDVLLLLLLLLLQPLQLMLPCMSAFKRPQLHPQTQFDQFTVKSIGV
jgi:hypothetical protein